MLTEANEELQASNTWTGPLEPVPRCGVTVMPRRGKGAESGAREVCITTPDLTDAEFLFRLARRCTVTLPPSRDRTGKGYGPPMVRWFVPGNQTRTQGGWGTWTGKGPSRHDGWL